VRLDIQAAIRRCVGLSSQEILAWAIETYWPSIVMSSSFQTSSLPLLHMVSRIKPQIRIYFLDTGYHYPETLAFKQVLRERWKLNVIDLRGEPDARGDACVAAEPLYRTNPDKCCHHHKVEPMLRVLRDTRAWITGFRREQNAQRSQTDVVECAPNGLIRINPIYNWTARDVHRYIKEHDLPTHPLLEQGYLSVGCAPCTRAVKPGEHERAGRWTGTDKTECGLLGALVHLEKTRHAKCT
jgi:phosphoadenosine phosphosulfate reductase